MQTNNRDQKLFSFRQALNCHFTEEKRLVQFLFISGWILWSDSSLESAPIHVALQKLRALYPLTPEQSLASGLLLLFRRPDSDLRALQRDTSCCSSRKHLLMDGGKGSCIYFVQAKLPERLFFLEARWFMCPLEAVHRSADVNAELQRGESY